MSVCVIVKVGEGLVMATDSASTIVGGPVLPDGSQGPQGVVKVFFSGRKLFQIGNLPVGVMSWGAGSFKERTIASLVEEFENLEKIRDIDTESLDISKLATDLWDSLLEASDRSFPDTPKAGRPKSGIVIGGYSSGEFFPEQYVMVVPDQQPNRLRPDKNGNPDFGASWFGMTDAIVRFHHGRDDKIFSIMKNHGVDDEAIEEIKEEAGRVIQYPVLFHAMPLPDAANYARFLVELTIARFRYVAGAELCGGPIVMATITRKNGLSYIQ